MNKRTLSLEKFIVDKPWILEIIFENQEFHEIDLGSSLFYLFFINNKADVIVDTSIYFLKKFGAVEFLRGNYLGSIILVEYAKLSAINYLKRYLGNIIEKYLNLNVVYSSLESKEIENEDQKLFSMFTREIIESLMNSMNEIPENLLNLMKYITSILNENNQKKMDNQFIVVTTIYFLRVIVPCIIDPVKFGLIQKDYKISNEGKKCLVSISKIVQSLVNNINPENSSEREWLIFFDQYRDRLSRYVDQLMDSKKWGPQSPPKVKRSLLIKHSQTLFEYLNNNSDIIINKMKVTHCPNETDSTPSFINKFIKVMNLTRKNFNIKESIPLLEKSKEKDLHFLPEEIVVKSKLIFDNFPVSKNTIFSRYIKYKEFLSKLAESHQITNQNKVYIHYTNNGHIYAIDSKQSFMDFLYFCGKSSLKDFEKQKDKIEDQNNNSNNFNFNLFPLCVTIQVFNKRRISLQHKKYSTCESPIIGYQLESAGFLSFSLRNTEHTKLFDFEIDKSRSNDLKVLKKSSSKSSLPTLESKISPSDRRTRKQSLQLTKSAVEGLVLPKNQFNFYQFLKSSYQTNDGEDSVYEVEKNSNVLSILGRKSLDVNRLFCSESKEIIEVRNN